MQKWNFHWFLFQFNFQTKLSPWNQAKGIQNCKISESQARLSSCPVLKGLWCVNVKRNPNAEAHQIFTLCLKTYKTRRRKKALVIISDCIQSLCRLVHTAAGPTRIWKRFFQTDVFVCWCTPVLWFFLLIQWWFCEAHNSLLWIWPIESGNCDICIYIYAHKLITNHRLCPPTPYPPSTSFSHLYKQNASSQNKLLNYWCCCNIHAKPNLALPLLSMVTSSRECYTSLSKTNAWM